MVSAKVKKNLQDSIPSTVQLDETILDYLGGILEEDQSISSEDFCGVASPFLMDSANIDSEESADALANEIFNKFKSLTVNPNENKATSTAEKVKLLGAPINLSQQKLAKEEETPDWMRLKEKPTLVDKDRLEALEIKKEKKREIKLQKEDTKKGSSPALAGSVGASPTVYHNVGGGAANASKDIHLENFDIAFGKDMLISNGAISLAFGRRYGLIGRNGTGKSTLMRHISNREIYGIPAHIRILHVEQEVAGTEITALQSVLECDAEREKLMAEEKHLTAQSAEDNSSRLKKIYDRLQEIDAFGAEARASSILAGLGFTSTMQAQATKEFSGGWRMRIALARALFCEPDLLILDEPTNHLDLFSCLWLENYLQTWKATILLVSHQRDFLNGVATDIIHLHNKKLEYYKGNYDMFETTRYEKLRQQSKQHEAQTKQRKHMQTFIDRFRFNAKRASMVQSRLKTLEKMQLVDEVLDDPTLTIKFPDPPVLTPPILQFNDATFGYTPDRILFRDLNMGVDMDSRVALLGANGAGKSTLMNLLAGENDVTSGNVVRNSKLRFARFSQHFVDQLRLDVSPVEHFMNTYPGVSIQTARSHLGSFGLSGDIVLRTVNTLSGGQKSRLVFAVLAWKQPHILLLDEPSNHLDIETIDSLAQALMEFKGGVLLISHDERLISLVCDELWYFHDGKVEKFPGEFAEYKKSLLDQLGTRDPLSASRNK